MKKLLAVIFSFCLLSNSLIAEDNIEALIAEAQSIEKQNVSIFDKIASSFIFIGGGSGVCISADGYMLTNQHVCSDADTWTVHDIHGKQYTANVVGRDTKGDLALLKIKNVTGMSHASFAADDSIVVGQDAYAVGDPFKMGVSDFIPSISKGIISGEHLYMNGFYSYTYSDAVQTDAAVNPGNSGGPLFNGEGEIVGINGQIRSNGIRANRGIGLAISSDRIKRYLTALKNAKGGIVLHGHITGVDLEDAKNDLVKGVLLKEIKKGSLAERKGLQEGDIVFQIGDAASKSMSQYFNLLHSKLPNVNVVLHILRKKKKITLNYKLDALAAPPKNFGPQIKPRGLPSNRRRSYILRTGIKLASKTMVIQNVETGGPAAAAGFRVGDELVEIEGKRSQLKSIFNKLRTPSGKIFVNIIVKRKIKDTGLSYEFMSTLQLDLLY